MIETAGAVVAHVTDYFAAHPAVGAVIWAWAFGVVTTQGAKRWYPIEWPIERVKRLSQSIATISAGAFAYITWPTTHALPFAALAGMACPQVYTALKWALPNILARWGWACIVEQKADKA